MLLDQSPQGSPEWLEARCGVLTASEFRNLITPTGKPTSGKTRRDYLLTKANERITGIPSGDQHVTAWMERGTELEPQARDTYTFLTDNEVTEAGLAYLNDTQRVGASVDGFVNDDGNLEIKCPKLSTHLSYLLDGKAPPDYVPQIQGQMLVTGKRYCDFLSFHPDACNPAFLIRVERDEEYIEKLASCIAGALAEIDELETQLRKLA